MPKPPMRAAKTHEAKRAMHNAPQNCSCMNKLGDITPIRSSLISVTVFASEFRVKVKIGYRQWDLSRHYGASEFRLLARMLKRGGSAKSSCLRILVPV